MKLYLILLMLSLLSCAGVNGLTEQRLIEGKKIAFARGQGNCLACHAIADGEFPGNIGPALTPLSSRFKNKQQLRDQIWDAGRFNPDTSMPPFGKNKIISDEDIDKIVDYLWRVK